MAAAGRQALLAMTQMAPGTSLRPVARNQPAPAAGRPQAYYNLTATGDGVGSSLLTGVPDSVRAKVKNQKGSLTDIQSIPAFQGLPHDKKRGKYMEDLPEVGAPGSVCPRPSVPRATASHSPSGCVCTCVCVRVRACVRACTRVCVCWQSGLRCRRASGGERRPRVPD